jgi:hypothetical protein
VSLKQHSLAGPTQNEMNPLQCFTSLNLQKIKSAIHQVRTATKNPGIDTEIWQISKNDFHKKGTEHTDSPHLLAMLSYTMA